MLTFVPGDCTEHLSLPASDFNKFANIAPKLRHVGNGDFE